jgi:hypothetical protein
MRAASLPRFLPGQLYGRAACFALLLSIALIVLLAAGVTDVAAAEHSPGFNPSPFRW